MEVLKEVNSFDKFLETERYNLLAFHVNQNKLLLSAYNQILGMQCDALKHVDSKELNHQDDSKEVSNADSTMSSPPHSSQRADYERDKLIIRNCLASANSNSSHNNANPEIVLTETLNYKEQKNKQKTQNLLIRKLISKQQKAEKQQKRVVIPNPGEILAASTEKKTNGAKVNKEDGKTIKNFIVKEICKPEEIRYNPEFIRFLAALQQSLKLLKEKQKINLLSEDREYFFYKTSFRKLNDVPLEQLIELDSYLVNSGESIELIKPQGKCIPYTADILMVWDLLNTFCLLFKFRKSSMTFEEFSDVILKDENLTLFKTIVLKFLEVLQDEGLSNINIDLAPNVNKEEITIDALGSAWGSAHMDLPASLKQCDFSLPRDLIKEKDKLFFFDEKRTTRGSKMFQKRRKTYDLRRTSERLRSHHRVEPRSTSHSETDNEEEFVIANEEEDHLEVTIETTTCPSANEDNSAALTDATCSSEELGTANLVGARPLFYEDELRSSFDNNISSSLATALSLTHAFLITTRDRVAELNPELDWSSLEHGLKEEPLAPEIKVLLLKTLGRTLLGSRSLRCFEDNYFLLLEQQHKERLRQKSTIRKFEKNKDENSPATSTWTNENEKELSNLKVAQYSAFRKQKLGEDRYGSYYWFFSTIPDKLFVESFTQQTGLIAEGSYGDLNSQWSYYTAKETSEAALCLNSFGYCERELKANIFHLAQVFNWPPPLPEVLESVKSQLLLKEPIVQKRKDDLIYKRNGRKILELTMHLHTYYKDLLKERQEEYEWMKESRKKSYDLFLRERLGVSEPSEHNLERNERSGILFFFAQQDLLLLDNMMRLLDFLLFC